jgi:hypothetical protein
MTDPEGLRCLCYWTGTPGQDWRQQTLTLLRARAHRWRHNRARRKAQRVAQRVP